MNPMGTPKRLQIRSRRVTRIIGKAMELGPFRSRTLNEEDSPESTLLPVLMKVDSKTRLRYCFRP